MRCSQLTYRKSASQLELGSGGGVGGEVWGGPGGQSPISWMRVPWPGGG